MAHTPVDHDSEMMSLNNSDGIPISLHPCRVLLIVSARMMRLVFENNFVAEREPMRRLAIHQYNLTNTNT
jgi:hypothetical protein